MDREHERRVSQLAALFGSDTNGHLRTNRNLTELWSQFDSRRRGALDQSEFTACLEFMASRSSAADAYISKDDAAQLWRRLDQHDDASKVGVVSVPSLVVFVRSALMAQWSQHRGTVDGTGPREPLATRTSTAESRTPSSDRRRRRLSSSLDNRSTRTGKASPARSIASVSATSKQRTVSPARSQRPSSVSPARTPRTHRPPSPGGVGLYDVLRRARVRAAFEADSIEVGYLEPGERVEVIESRNTRDGDKRVKVLFERGVVDWTGQRRVGWTSLVTPSGSILLLPVNGKVYRPSTDNSVSKSSNHSVRRFSSGGIDLSAISAEAQVPAWVKRLTATPSSERHASARRPSSVRNRRSSASVRPSSGSRSSRTRSRSPSPLRTPGRVDDTIVQAEQLIQQLSPKHDSLHQTSATSKTGLSSHRRSPSVAYDGDATADLASANAKLAVTVARTQNPELAAGLAQAEMMIEDVRMDCARRVAEAEASRQTAEDEAGQLRRALRNAVDELQRTVTERSAKEKRDALAEDALQSVNLKLAAVQEENEQLRVKAAARPPVDLCGLWRAKGIDADGQEVDDSFVLRVSDDGQRIVGSHGPDADPAEYFSVEDVLVKDSLDLSGGESVNQPKRNDTERSVVLSFVQRYDDPGAMPTRWQARLEPPGMVGWWFTDADDDGVQDEDENGGTFTATRESTSGQVLPQATTQATSVVKAAKAEAAAAASAAKVYLNEAEEASAALAAAEHKIESLKKQMALTEDRLTAAVQKAESLDRDAATRAERIAELEENLRAEIAAGEDRAQGYREDLEAAASKVDSLAAALSEAQRIASSNCPAVDASPAMDPVERRREEMTVAAPTPQSPSSGSASTASASSNKTKEQLYAEATARVAQELAAHRQKWSKT